MEILDYWLIGRKLGDWRCYEGAVYGTNLLCSYTLPLLHNRTVVHIDQTRARIVLLASIRWCNGRNVGKHKLELIVRFSIACGGMWAASTKLRGSIDNAVIYAQPITPKHVRREFAIGENLGLQSMVNIVLTSEETVSIQSRGRSDMTVLLNDDILYLKGYFGTWLRHLRIMETML